MDTKVLKKVEIGRTQRVRHSLGSLSSVASAAARPRNDRLCSWMDNPDVQRLLDAVSAIIADEYIEVAKKNPEIFIDSRFRGNDNERR